MKDDYDPTKYSDEDLIDVFWAVDKDKFSFRYQVICDELTRRKIPYEDMSQSERKLRNLEHEVEVTSSVIEMFRSIGNLYNVPPSLTNFLRNLFK